MRLISSFSFGTIGLALGLAFWLAVTAAPVWAEPSEQQAVLEEKGLTLQGITYVLEAEQELPREMAKVRKLKADLMRVERERNQFERKIRRAKAIIANMEYELNKLTGDTRKAMTKDEYNALVERINTLKADIEAATKEKAEREKQMQQKYDEAMGKYATELVKVAEKVDATEAAYEALAKDEAVSNALKQLNEESNRRYLLGPGSAFKSIARLVTRERDAIQTGEIPLRKEGNILWVDVRLNGNATRSMVLDTGADSVVLPYDLAKEIDMVPGENDPTVRVQLADGRIVEAKQMTLELVQVGQFIVKDVVCVVLPEDMIAAHPLLGGSYLGHFTYRVDPERGRMLMTRTDGEGQE